MKNPILLSSILLASFIFTGVGKATEKREQKRTVAGIDWVLLNSYLNESCGSPELLICLEGLSAVKAGKTINDDFLWDKVKSIQLLSPRLQCQKVGKKPFHGMAPITFSGIDTLSELHALHWLLKALNKDVTLRPISCAD